MKYRVNKGLITQKLDDKTVIFDGEKSLLFTFNKTASFIFNKIKAKWEDDKIIKAMAKEYGIKETKAKKDYGLLLADMLKKKILISF
jgi:phage gp16-like protein